MEMEFETVVGRGGEIKIADCDHLREKKLFVQPALTVPIGDAKYIIICQRCAAGLELDILEKWAGIERNLDESRPAGVAEIPPPYQQLRQTIEKKLEEHEKADG